MQTFYRCLKFALCAVLLLTVSSNGWSQDLTSREKRKVSEIESAINRAGRQYKKENFEACANSFAKAQELMEAAVADASPALLEALKPEHARLVKAHELLKAQGQEVEDVKPLSAEAGGGEAVSFKTDVVPIITARCGRCHVQGNRGRFSAATFDSLMNSGHVDPGMPDVSRFIEVIEDGDMPPGGSLTDEEVGTLKLWIQQGAKADVARDQNIGRLAEGDQPEQAALEVEMATGKETVSFANDVAPVLVENCAGCHVDVRNNARGGLNMTTFRQLLRGGDAGPMLKPGDGKDSFLVKKLLGTGGGNRMPQGRAALSEKTIKMITTWIDEGAKFDGVGPTVPVRTVAARAKAASMSHDELSAQRKKLAAEKWRIVMSDDSPNMSETFDFQVVSSYDQERVDKIAGMVQGLTRKIRQAAKVGGSNPMVKGRVTIFVFERRYDFNEFGVMVEGREIPKSYKTRWGFDTINAYVALLLTRNQDPETAEAILTRDIGAVYFASLGPAVPRWFAEGMGYWVAEDVLRGSDIVEEWETESKTLAEGMNRPDDFIAGRIPDDQAALVGFYFIKQLRAKGSKPFNRMLDMLRDDRTFDDSFREIYGVPPTEFVGGRGGRRR